MVGGARRGLRGEEGGGQREAKGELNNEPNTCFIHRMRKIEVHRIEVKAESYTVLEERRVVFTNT